jgi:hypothetical protein
MLILTLIQQQTFNMHGIKFQNKNFKEKNYFFILAKLFFMACATNLMATKSDSRSDFALKYYIKNGG